MCYNLNYNYYDKKCDELVEYVKKEYNFSVSWYAVKVKYKYSHESRYSVTWEVFCLYDDGKTLSWFDDWYEGEDDIEFLEIITDKDCDYISHDIRRTKNVL